MRPSPFGIAWDSTRGLRPLLVKTANRFAAEVTIEKDGVEVNGKSIMGILMLAASKGTKITLKTEGKDANQAMQTLGKLIEDKFGEE